MKHKRRYKKRQQGLLRLFWLAWFDQDTDRVELLRDYAEKKCRMVSLEEMRRSRVKFEKAKHAGLGVAGEGICQACYQVGPRVWHHIIQIQHGGVARSENLVKICERCHARVHPWLETGRTQLLPDEAYKPFWS